MPGDWAPKLLDPGQRMRANAGQRRTSRREGTDERPLARRVLPGDAPQADRVDAVALVGRGVVALALEEVPEVGAAGGAADLDPAHPQGPVLEVLDPVLGERGEERGPAAVAVELLVAAEQLGCRRRGTRRRPRCGRPSTRPCRRARCPACRSTAYSCGAQPAAPLGVVEGDGIAAGDVRGDPCSCSCVNRRRAADVPDAPRSSHGVSGSPSDGTSGYACFVEGDSSGVWRCRRPMPASCSALRSAWSNLAARPAGHADGCGCPPLLAALILVAQGPLDIQERGAREEGTRRRNERSRAGAQGGRVRPAPTRGGSAVRRRRRGHDSRQSGGRTVAVGQPIQAAGSRMLAAGAGTPVRESRGAMAARARARRLARARDAELLRLAAAACSGLSLVASFLLFAPPGACCRSGAA